MSPQKHSQCHQLDADAREIIQCINDGHRVFVLLRGVTGSGKTTLAQRLVEAANTSNQTSTIISEDTVGSKQLTKTVRQSFEDDVYLVVVDAENVERNVVKKLADLAVKSYFECFVTEPDTEWRHDASECKIRSSRGEGVESIERKIEQIKNSPIDWECIIPGANVTIGNSLSEDTPPTPPTSSMGSSNSLLNVSTTSTRQLFSMVPEKKKKRSVKTVSTYVTNECIVLELAGLIETSGLYGYSLKLEEEVEEKQSKDVKIVNKKTETEEVIFASGGRTIFRPEMTLLTGTEEEIQFSSLRSIFPETDLFVLRHFLQIFGYSEAVAFFKATTEDTVLPILPTDDRILLEELDAMESFTISNMTIEEEIEARRSEREALRFVEDIDTENDEQIARILHNEFNGEDYQLQNTDDYDIARLIQNFSTTDIDYIRQLYEIWANNYENTYQCLIENGAERTEPLMKGKQTFSQTLSSASPIRRDPPKKSQKEEKNHFLKAASQKTHHLLQDVQLEALKSRQQIEKNRFSQNSYCPTTSSRYSKTVMMSRVERLKEGVSAQVKDIDRKIKEAHNNPWNLDLHYMSVDGAVELVLEAIEAVRYHVKYTNKRGRRITVVTGSGNNSRCGARIKPKVISMLDSQNISYEMLNDGCIQVKV
ncbi:hypothetical protein GCK72_010011 [Caenorhabditis remanei]|uniref:Smr domain-containing protein n=1 Tax=Caenorhabditis remanei TaxID=31234 RepID=A0A6A5H423_CAERE|nr:hypothetical protein GCK72_010011 [Caenorhabditis remanei]KAF1761755.1 hypothetical protein GCK72_010011 [Caenorhabditis remanei]